MVVTCQEMAAAEAAFFSGGRSPEPYMDEAGRRCAEAIRSFLPEPAVAEVFVGKGNNGGDALVIARWLKCWGWGIRLHFSHGPDGLSELAAKKLVEFEQEAEVACPPLFPVTAIVDGLVGIGVTGELRGPVAELAGEITRLREETGAWCFAVDIPSGLDGDTGRPGQPCVVADYTLSITAPKQGFVTDGSENHVGRLVDIPLSIPVPAGGDSLQFLFPRHLSGRLPRRRQDFHKGNAGRVALCAGSPGMAGAPVLAARAASLVGAGLVTLYVPEDIHSVVAAKTSPEIMVRSYASGGPPMEGSGWDALAVGPGMGLEGPDEWLLDLLVGCPVPMVVDADALNRLARHPQVLAELPANRILTPHPGELRRLYPEATGAEDRVALTRCLADLWGVTLLHKGARTAVASPGHPVELNTTGHPGMASGGMGDVLTGMCAGLLAQGISPHDAACLGSWLLGRSAEICAVRNRIAPESVTAVDILAETGRALRDLRHQWPG